MILLKASLCIVTYNNSAIISDALNSVLNNTTGTELDIFVVDNASTDGTPDIVEKVFPFVRLIRCKDNKGFGGGHNAILNVLDSDFHFILNPDILVKDNIITHICEFMSNNSDIAMLVPKFLYEDGREQFTPKLTPTFRYMLGGRLERFGGIFRKWRKEYTFADKNVNEVTDVGFCSGCFIVIRTDVFQKVGGFDERYFLYS